MAESTLQFDWIVKLKENLEILFADRPDVFVAGDLFWYPVPDRQVSDPLAPDAMVVFGRPKGPRGSYKQWEEDGIAPQVVFEVQSPSNSVRELRDKLDFYDTYGAEEYYLYDPERNRLDIWLRQAGRLAPVAHVNGWTSPRLGIRFALRPQTMEVFDPAGRPFLSPVELARQAREAEAQARELELRARQEQARAAEADARAVRADARAERLAERLRALGIDPDASG